MTGPLQSTSPERDHYPETKHGDDLTDHERDQSMASGKTYEPGASFVDSEPPTDRLAEMPAWLQTFAAQESAVEDAEDEPLQKLVEPEQSLHAAEPEAEISASDMSGLPDWLQDGTDTSDSESMERAPGASGTPAVQPVSDDSNPDGFISEDDLPDWLRAFSESSTVPTVRPPDSNRLRTPPAISTGSVTAVRVPPVESIWLSTHDRQALGPGGTLFALLASNGSADGGISSASYGESASETASARQRASYPVPGVSEPDGAQKTSDQPAEKQSSSVRLLLLTLLVVFLVIAVSFWQFG